jgi:hypothetical protein
MLQNLEELKGNVKNFLYFDGYTNFKMLDPSYDIKGLTEEEAWGTTPSTPGSKIAEGDEDGWIPG